MTRNIVPFEHPLFRLSQEAGAFENIFDLVFNDLFSRRGFVKDIGTKSTYPKADLYKEGDTIVAELAVPGLDKKDIEIQLVEDTLWVSGEKQEQNETIEGMLHKELRKSKFERGFQLGNFQIDNEKEITAKLEKGILKITVPLAQEKSPALKSIKIQ